ncbi:hypothetical protein HWV62_36358 [Athelia sp. TMB]|nr:hypothetical protein HWV62_36358 [Athelia sp. TMB]
MDVLVQDLGTTEIITLYGERLKAAREKIEELEKVEIPMSGLRANELIDPHHRLKRLAAKTIECAFHARQFKKADANRAAFRQELHKLTTEAESAKREVTCTDPAHALELTTKNERIKELTAELDLKNQTEETHLQSIDTLYASLAAYKSYKQKYKDLKKRLKVEEPMTELDQGTNLAQEFGRSRTSPLLTPFSEVTFKEMNRIVSSFPPPASRAQAYKQETELQSGSHAWVCGHARRPGVHSKKLMSTYERWYGTEGEVFVGTKPSNKIHYMGRYKAVRLPNLKNDDFAMLPNVQHILHRVSSQAERSLSGAEDLVRRGDVDLECMGLQFIDFNESIFRDLTTSRSPAQAPVKETKKRKHKGSGKKSSKKRKIG